MPQPTVKTMSEERRKRLNSLGFIWKVREAYIIVSWEVSFQELVEDKRVHGNLADEREAKLMAIGFVFEKTPHDDEEDDWGSQINFCFLQLPSSNISA